MQISNVNEDSGTRKLYLGIENFQATAVNPTLKELVAMGIPATVEPEYNVKVMRDYDGKGEVEYDAVNIRIYLTNNNPANLIRTQVNYQIIKAYHLSSTDKFSVLNKYGSSTWLEDKHLTAGTLPTNMHWFVNEDIKRAYRGEDVLIDFIKAYRNLPNIALTSDADTKKKGLAIFSQSDLDKLFAGNFTDIRDVVMSIGEKGKCGFLMGVRHLEDKDVQTIYRQSPLKRYIKKTNKNDYLIKDVVGSQENGMYADVTFDLNNLQLKEFTGEEKVEASSAEEIEAYAEEHDDLPF